jgi:hypothetical protein
MFDDLNNKTKGAVEDIFSGSDKPAGPASAGAGGLPEKPTVFQPKKETAAGLSEYSGVSGEKGASDSIGNVKKILVLGVIILGLALVVYGGWWAYSNFGKGILAPAGEETAGGEANNIGEGEQETVENSGNAEEAIPAVEQSRDSDEDGLSDEEEKQLGIDSGSVDSDNDNLFDREEVKVYKTDPLNPDTDGDGHKDGDEVKAGYDPNGPGKLYDIK